jgi:predicted nucleotidyltransferase
MVLDMPTPRTSSTPRTAAAPRTREPPVEEITRRIVEAFHPLRVMMFGSRARGDHRPDSDMDVFVEMETALRPVDRMRAVYALFPRTPWPMDEVVFTPAEVTVHRNYRNSILRVIEAEGKVLYARAEGDGTGRVAG